MPWALLLRAGGLPATPEGPAPVRNVHQQMKCAHQKKLKWPAQVSGQADGAGLVLSLEGKDAGQLGAARAPGARPA